MMSAGADPRAIPAELEAFARHCARGGDIGAGLIDTPVPHSKIALVFAIVSGIDSRRETLAGCWTGPDLSDLALAGACRAAGIQLNDGVIATLSYMTKCAMLEMVGE